MVGPKALQPVVVVASEWKREHFEAVNLLVGICGAKVILPIAEALPESELADFNAQLARFGIRARRKARWDLGLGTPGREAIIFTRAGEE